MTEKTTSRQKTTSEILETQADDPILWEFVAEKWRKRIQNAWFLNDERITIDAPTKVRSSQASLRMVPPITLSIKWRQTETTEISNTPDGPWSEWRTVIIGEQGTTEVDLDEGAEKHFYRVRD